MMLMESEVVHKGWQGREERLGGEGGVREGDMGAVLLYLQPPFTG